MAVEDEYEELHAAMEREGFSRVITASDGITYCLPRAEYNFVGNHTRAQVLAAAQRAANSTGRESEILVTKSAGRTWSGLATE